MTNKIFRDKLGASIDHCLAEYKNSAALDHPGLIGTVRQIFIQNLLLPLLPETMKIGTGKITDCDGSLSAETDIIIYDRRSIPPIMYDEKMGLFPIESVHVALEIKSTLNKINLKSSIENGKKLRLLKGPIPVSALFAFSSDLKEKDELDRFNSIHAETYVSSPMDSRNSPISPINIICVSGKEFFCLRRTGWGTVSADGKNDEIFTFLIALMNTLVKIAHERTLALEPGYYFYDRPIGYKKGKINY